MSDYSPDSEIPGGFKMDAFIPVVLLAVSLIVFFVWQIINTNAERTQLESVITRQVPAITQAQKVQDSVTKLVNDLLAAAQTDATAKAIVDKYQIKSAGAPGADAAPSPGL
jgi:hypothetical protein